jgi:hypothetical protein
LDTFESFPVVAFRKLSDMDTIPSMRQKIQHNFDQIYLHYVNKILKGEKGERGFNGLSIKGDKGDKGDKGSIIHFLDVSDGQPVSTPTHLEDDIIITSFGSYYTVVDDGNGVLIYSLSFAPSVSSLFVVQSDFENLGVVNNHTELSATSTGAAVLAVKDGFTAKYMRLILGNNSYNSATKDTLTLVNILDGADFLTSTESKQLSLRYRDTANGAISATAFDFFYDIASNIEYKYIGDKITNFGIKKNNTTGETTGVINTDVFLFTAGVSNWKVSTETDSLSIKKTSGVWRIKQPTPDELRLGDGDLITLKDGKVGVGLQTDPQEPIDAIGNLLWKSTNENFVVHGQGSYFRLEGFTNHFELTENKFDLVISANNKVSITPTSFDAMLDVDTRVFLSTAGGGIRHSFVSEHSVSPTMTVSKYGNLESTISSTAHVFRRDNNSRYIIMDVDGVRIRHTKFNPIPLPNTVHDLTFNELGLTLSGDIIPQFGTSIGLKNAIKIVRQTEASQAEFAVADGQWLTNFTGGVSGSAANIGFSGVNWDRILTINPKSGTGVMEVSINGVEMGHVSVGSVGTFIIPQGVNTTIRSTGGSKSAVRVVIQRFGV